MTDNLAERTLRHWVISRRISQGTRTEQGPLVFSLLAGVIQNLSQPRRFAMALPRPSRMAHRWGADEDARCLSRAFARHALIHTVCG